jgi:two-component system chemotaxis response regulator CheB
MAAPYRVLVVDDSAFMRKALSRRIETDSRFKVIDTAQDGKEAIEKALRLKPDVMTLDVEMPLMNGIEALKVIVAKSSVPVVMVSAVTLDGAKVTLDALEIGAVDFIPKSRGAELIHEKLIAAVTANIRRPQPRPVAAGAVQPAPLRTLATTSTLASQVSRPMLRPSGVVRVAAKVVVIGSSTGGPQALQQVIAQLPENLPVPVVIAQHMPPQFTLALAKRLDDTCPPKVVEAKDGDPLTRGVVYIAPGGMHLRVTPNGLRVDKDKGESLYKPSVDVLAESALNAFGKNVLGVMLTGMGNDGTKEFVKLKKAGAYNLAQDQASCVVYGMPRSVVEAGGADEVIPLERMGARIREVLGG